MKFTSTLLAFLPALTLAAPLTERQIPATMSITNFTRNCTDPNVCTYYFNIVVGGSTQYCIVTDFATPATTHPFSSIPCETNGDWVVSWGWDYPGDFTVMTVVNKPGKYDAFFGYNHPNVGNPIISYPDVGPNTVYAM